MKNILINYLGRKGAGAVFSYEMTKGLIENGANVYAIIPKTIENIEEWKKLPLIKLVEIDTYNDSKSFVLGIFRYILKDKWRIKKEFRNASIDTIYIPMLQPWAELVNSIFPKARLITTLHDPIPHSGSRSIMNWLYARVAKKSSDLIILSEIFKKDTSSIYGIPEEKIHVIPHGIFDYYSAYHPKPIERHSQVNFLFFGRITKYKGLHVLAQAYKKLHKEYQDSSLFVVGSGDFSEYKAEFPPDDNITVVNRFIKDDEIVAFFRGRNIVTVLPYTDATQSGVIPIAMKEESLLIVSNKGGLVEQTDNGKYAILIEPDPESLYKAMKNVVENYDQYSDLLIEAKKYIESLSWDRLSKKLLSIIEDDA